MCEALAGQGTNVQMLRVGCHILRALYMFLKNGVGEFSFTAFKRDDGQPCQL